MQQPTKKQTALLKFIEDFSEEHNFSPSYREIMRALNLNSVSAVAEHINNCVEAGFLKKVPGAARSLKVIPIQDYKETRALFRQKLADLNAKLASEDTSESKKTSLKDDIRTLYAAAAILGIEL